MHEQLVDTLVRSRNEAADDLLLEGLRVRLGIGTVNCSQCADARKTARGMMGVVGFYEQLPDKLQINGAAEH